MSLIGCTGSRLTDALLHAIEEAIKEDAPKRLHQILKDGAVSADELNRKNLLHKAAWLGYTDCINVILSFGADPNYAHRKNGCTPLHLAHFCTVEETNPNKSVAALLQAGANVNSLGSKKCGKGALHHAIQHQRLDAVEVLVKHNAVIKQNSVHLAIDVANPNILELLLLSGGSCGKTFSTMHFWGTAFERVLSTPVKCPKVWYKNMFKLITEASVCSPMQSLFLSVDYTTEWQDLEPKLNLLIENKLTAIAHDYVDLAIYFFVYLVRNGYKPNVTVFNYVSTLKDLSWVSNYIQTAPSLKELSVRAIRSHLVCSGNILHGIHKLSLPTRLKELILFQFQI